MIVSPFAAAALRKWKVSLPAPPSITLTATLAVMWSAPDSGDDVLDTPQRVGSGLRAHGAAVAAHSGSEIDVRGRGDRRHVERVDAAAAIQLVAEIAVVAVADLGHEAVVARPADDRVGTCAAR